MANSACIEKLSCPDCIVQPNTHLQTYTNEDPVLDMQWYTSYCHVCCEQKGDMYGDKIAPKVVVKTPQQLREETNDVKSCKMFSPKGGYRGIPAKFYKNFSCRLLLSEFDGKTPNGIAFPYSSYGKLCGWKARLFKLNKEDKKVFFAIGRTANVDLFGLARALALGGDTLWITEGEFDAIALEYCLTLVGNQSKYPVTSLTAGGGAIVKDLDYIESRVKRNYKNIILVMDNDLVGRTAEKAAINLWGDMVICIKKPKGSKDANDAVKAGQALEMGRLALNFKRQDYENTTTTNRRGRNS